LTTAASLMLAFFSAKGGLRHHNASWQSQATASINLRSWVDATCVRAELHSGWRWLTQGKSATRRMPFEHFWRGYRRNSRRHLCDGL